MNQKKFYVTTTIYYVNDVPHVGHAYTTLAGDVVARYWREKLGRDNVFFLTGTDEHGQKVQQGAEEQGLTPKAFSDKVAPRFEEAWKLLGIDYGFFIRTTDPRHEKVVVELLEKVHKNGFIYKGKYSGLYCVGCEKFLTETDLENGRCPLHPNKEPEYQEEENYFLKLKELSKIILEKIEAGEYQILPEKRKNEIVSRIKQGVEDISISRAGVTWGIPLPWDKQQTIYVWVDALINYYSATQFVPGKKRFWPADLHLIGKDIVWFHTVIWQALLIAAGIEAPRTIFAHGFFTVDGQKISKSLGNAIAPKQLVDKYGVDGTRYLILSAYSFGEDGDISFVRFDEKYNANLANGLGNTVSRIAKLCENSGFEFHKDPIGYEVRQAFVRLVENYKLDEAVSAVLSRFAQIDREIDNERPWEQEGQGLEKLLEGWVEEIRRAAYELKPLLPETAEKILAQFKGPKILSEAPLFPRL